MGTFQNNLNTLRKNSGFSLQELANRLNNKYDVKFSKTSLDRWEKGESSPSVTQASALAHFFNVSLDELSGIEELDIEDNKIEAAHFDKEDLTEEERKQVKTFIDFLKGNRDK